MRKNYFRNLVAAAALLVAASASAAPTLYPINGINYAILDETAKTAYVYEAVDKTTLSGDIVLPEKVTIEGTEYTLTCIDGVAFKDCEGITTMTVPSTIDSIGLQAFNGCTNMTAMNLGDTKIRHLSVSTFLYCRSLKTVTIPATVTSYGTNPFMETNSLESIVVAEGNKVLKNIGSGVYTISGKTLVCWPGGVKNAVVAEGTDSIATMAFCQDRVIESVSLPNSVIYIGGSAFMRMDALQKIEIPENIKYIGSNAWAECKAAKGEIVVPEGCNVLSKAFYWTSITKLELPGNLSTIPSSIAQYCVQLRSVTLHEGPTMIMDGAFATCAISDIVIPNSVTTLKNTVFEGSTLLKNVTCGTGIKSFGIRVFYNLTGIQSITLPVATPPSIDDYPNYPAFTSTVYQNATLYVPQEAIETYKAADTWKNFQTIETAGVNGIETDEISVQKVDGGIAVLGANDMEIRVFNLTGALVYSGREGIISLPAGGVYIISVGNRTFKLAI